MEPIAIVGTGIAGMAAAHALKHKARLTLFEQEAYIGGHTRTETIAVNGQPVDVDTGFMVYNEVTYPELTRLFSELKVPTTPTNMSFGVQHKSSGLEYCGSSINQVFAQRSNLLRPSFWKMLRDIVRFNRLATEAVKNHKAVNLSSLAEFTHQHRFGKAFLDHYLLPMTSAIWSTPPHEMLAFPATTLFRFMFNHGLLGVNTQHQWRTVVGGSKVYRDKLIADFKSSIRTQIPIKCVRKIPDAVELIDHQGNAHRFKRVILATHADQALKLLEQPSESERTLLKPFQYSKNTITVHTDTSIMPQRKRAWASWNYVIQSTEDTASAATHYWMNALQPLKTNIPLFVSVNGESQIDPSKIIRQFVFDHPTFNEATLKAQVHLPRLNENGKIYFAGSYFRYGFHEDALTSGFQAASVILKDQIRKNAKLAI